MLARFKKSSAAMGRVGLAFGRDQLAVAVVRRDRGAPVLERCELWPMPPGGGDNAATAAIRAAELPRIPVSTVLRSDDYRLVLVEAPKVPPAEMRAAMRWRLKETIDFRVEDAVIDIFDAPAQHRGGQERMMYAVAAQRSAVDRCTGALTGVPTFDVLDVPELCLRNLATLLPAAAAGVALLHLGETKATVILVRETTFYFARQMDLATVPVAPGNDPDARLDAGGIVLELQRSLDYYESHFDQPPITRIAVSPGGKRASLLAADLARETGFEVDTLDLASLLRCDTSVEAALDPGCLLAVGAALRQNPGSP